MTHPLNPILRANGYELKDIAKWGNKFTKIFGNVLLGSGRFHYNTFRNISLLLRWSIIVVANRRCCTAGRRHTSVAPDDVTWQENCFGGTRGEHEIPCVDNGLFFHRWRRQKRYDIGTKIQLQLTLLRNYSKTHHCFGGVHGGWHSVFGANLSPHGERVTPGAVAGEIDDWQCWEN